MNVRIKIFSLLTALLAAVVLSPASKAQVVVTRDIVFPVIGPVTYGNDFGDPRDGGTRYHKGNDMLGKKMQLLVAVTDGIIQTVPYPQASWGYGVIIKDKDGYEYSYIHINNDTPGTDDGKANAMFAYAPDVAPGNPVVKGQLIGYMGDSGNAEGGPAHLHFEIEAPGAGIMNPYPSLKAAQRLSAPVQTYPELPKEILPYGAFEGGASVAVANFDVDSSMEVATGARSGGGPLVRVFDVDKQSLSSFYAFDPGFRGGVDIAAGDIDGDGASEIIAAAGPGGGPHVRVFKTNGSLVSEFFAYGATFRGGVEVSAGDIDGDGKAEIITGAGPGGGPHIRVFTAAGTAVKEFLAYDVGFRGGVDVAVMPKTTEWAPLIITAPLSKGGPHIKYFDGATTNLTKEFFAYEPEFTGGVRIAVGNTDKSSKTQQVLTIPASGGGPHLKVFSWEGASVKDAFPGFEEWWHGGYDIAGYDGALYIVSGPGRRTSLRSFNLNENGPQNRQRNSDKDDSLTPLTK